MRGLIFDLDGTLVDTAYAHILAWQHAFDAEGEPVSCALLHPLIGLSGELLVAAVGRELGRRFGASELKRLEHAHLRHFKRVARARVALPGAVALLHALTRRGAQHGIATSGKRDEIAPSLAVLRLDPKAVVVDGEQTPSPKPAPEPVLLCLDRLRIPKEECYLVGDSIWDMLAARRAGMHSLGLLSGGRTQEELAHAGASRVFRNPANLLGAIDELGLK